MGAESQAGQFEEADNSGQYENEFIDKKNYFFAKSLKKVANYEILKEFFCFKMKCRTLLAVRI